MKINISFITSNDFSRLCLFVFVVPTSKHKYVSVFSYSCPRFQCLYIFKNLCIDYFQYKLSSVWSYIFLSNGPDKKPKQNNIHSNKKPMCLLTNCRQPTKLFLARCTGTLRWLASLHCLLYFLAFDWLWPAVLFFLNWTVCLFVKGSPIWNYPNLSLIGQFVKIKG